MTQAQAIFLAFTVCAAFVALRYWLGVNRVRRMHEEHEKSFPGRCFVCSYWSYCIREGRGGIEPGELPPDHRCCERWDRWKGALHEVRK